MSLFDDVKAMETMETATEKELKKRFSLLEAKYKSSLGMIQTLCSQVESLKSQLVNAENSKREEVRTLERECAETRNAFAAVMNELKRSKKQKASITKNRNFWRRECRAADMLYSLAMEENEELRRKEKTISPELKSTPVQGVFKFENAEPVKIAAAIGK